MRRFTIMLPLMAALTLAGIVSPVQAEEAPLVQTEEGKNGARGDCAPDAPPPGELLTTGDSDGIYPDGQYWIYYRFVVDPGETKQLTVTVRHLGNGDPDSIDGALFHDRGIRLNHEVEWPNGQIVCEQLWIGGIGGLASPHRWITQTPVLEAGEYWLAIAEGGTNLDGSPNYAPYAVVAH